MIARWECLKKLFWSAAIVTLHNIRTMKPVVRHVVSYMCYVLLPVHVLKDKKRKYALFLGDNQ